jgi:hypothetical protein
MLGKVECPGWHPPGRETEATGEGDVSGLAPPRPQVGQSRLHRVDMQREAGWNPEGQRKGRIAGRARLGQGLVPWAIQRKPLSRSLPEGGRGIFPCVLLCPVFCGLWFLWVLGVRRPSELQKAHGQLRIENAEIQWRLAARGPGLVRRNCGDSGDYSPPSSSGWLLLLPRARRAPRRPPARRRLVICVPRRAFACRAYFPSATRLPDLLAQNGFGLCVRQHGPRRIGTTNAGISSRAPPPCACWPQALRLPPRLKAPTAGHGPWFSFGFLVW